MKEKLDENFIKSLVVIALGIVRGKSDPYELVNGAVEYLISNKEKYMDHPNLKAVAVLKMKGLYIDEIRKTTGSSPTARYPKVFIRQTILLLLRITNPSHGQNNRTLKTLRYRGVLTKKTLISLIHSLRIG